MRYALCSLLLAVAAFAADDQTPVKPPRPPEDAATPKSKRSLKDFDEPDLSKYSAALLEETCEMMAAKESWPGSITARKIIFNKVDDEIGAIAKFTVSSEKDVSRISAIMGMIFGELVQWRAPLHDAFIKIRSPESLYELSVPLDDARYLAKVVRTGTDAEIKGAATLFWDAVVKLNHK